jgi:surface protein
MSNCGAEKKDGKLCTFKGKKEYGGRCGTHKKLQDIVSSTPVVKEIKEDLLNLPEDLINIINKYLEPILTVTLEDNKKYKMSLNKFYEIKSTSIISTLEIYGDLVLINPKNMFKKGIISKILTHRGTIKLIGDCSGMFEECGYFNCDINDWDVSECTNMSKMFSALELVDWNGGERDLYYKSVFNSNLSKWDVSNVTDMSGMFLNATEFNSDISEWDTSQVTDMSEMFYNSQFNSNISKWDVSKVTYSSYFTGFSRGKKVGLRKTYIPKFLYW